MNTHSNSALAQHAKLKVVPRTIRETFEMLSEINSEGSLETQLSALDWTGVTTHQVYGAFLDRLPESWSVVRHFSKVDPLRHALACLKSAEFQGRVIELILHAYPEKRRLIHVHVPKTAGVDLREQLVRKYPHIHDSQTAQDFGTAPLHRHLSDFSRQVQRSDTIFVTGHIPPLNGTSLVGFADMATRYFLYSATLRTVCFRFSIIIYNEFESVLRVPSRIPDLMRNS